jgi:hypothetical protein
VRTQDVYGVLSALRIVRGVRHKAMWEGKCGMGGGGGPMDSGRQEEVARTSGQKASHPNTLLSTAPPGLRVRAYITPHATTTSREAFFGFEEREGVFLSLDYFGSF